MINVSGAYFIKPCAIGRVRRNSTVLAWLTLCYKPFREGAKAVFMACKEFYEFPRRFPFPLSVPAPVSVSLEFYLPTYYHDISHYQYYRSALTIIVKLLGIPCMPNIRGFPCFLADIYV